MKVIAGRMFIQAIVKVAEVCCNAI